MSKNSIKKLCRLSAYTTRSSFLERLRSNDENSWKEFHVRYVNMIRYIGTKKGLSEEECKDLMVEVMLVFWKKMHSFDYDPERGKFRSYLGRIAQLVSRAILRHRPKPHQDIPVEYPAEINVAQMEEWKEFLLEKALEELKTTVDTETFQTFYMLVFQEKTISEVTAVTRKSPNAVYNIRYRCTKKLKEIIDDYRKREEAEFSDESQSHSQRKA